MISTGDVNKTRADGTREVDLYYKAGQYPHECRKNAIGKQAHLGIQ